MIPKHEYYEAIEALKVAMTQLQPDGLPCALCGDIDHQAFECLNNPLVMAHSGTQIENSWRCFHCNRVFTDREDATYHFGESNKGRPVCQT